jgi:hypothetical protein
MSHKKMPAVQRKRKRNSTSLYTKLQVVNRYFQFVEQARHGPKPIRDFLDDTEENIRKEKSIRAFLDEENKHKVLPEPLESANIFKWLKAYDRGDYFEWGTLNDLTKPNARCKEILQNIRENLNAKFPLLAVLHKVVRSPSSPDQYGVTARQTILPGTFLGFLEGSVISTEMSSYTSPEGPYMFTVTENDNSLYIDCSQDFTACFGRYYNSSTKSEAQNVSVVRLPSTATDNLNNRICFIANELIHETHELIIGVDLGYSRNSGTYQRYPPAKCNFSLEYVIEKANQYIQAETLRRNK